MDRMNFLKDMLNAEQYVLDSLYLLGYMPITKAQLLGAQQIMDIKVLHSIIDDKTNEELFFISGLARRSGKDRAIVMEKIQHTKKAISYIKDEIEKEERNIPQPP